MSHHGCPERLSNRSKGFQEDGPSQPTMEVLVETLTGTAFEMTVSPTDTIFAIKSKIFRVEGIPVSQQHLLYNLKELDNASMLREHAISDGARLRLVLGMCGGPITTRRLPPPPSAEPWRDIERLLDTSREETEWGSNGCKVTVLVFREGERVNMLRVRENRDGSYEPLENNKYSSSLSHLLEQEPDDGLSGSLHENAVTMGKMLDLRRRMENLSVQRRRTDRPDKPEIQKTRSEETLSVGSLLEPLPAHAHAHAHAYEDDAFRYRLQYHCALNDRYSVLPGIGVRSESEQSVLDALDALEALDAGDPHPHPHPHHVPAQDYGPLVGGAGGAGGWRAARFGSAGSVGAGALLGGLPRASLLSSSTDELEQRDKARILPSLSRHRNREHLHLSDEGLHLPRSLEVGSERRQRRTQRAGPALPDREPSVAVSPAPAAPAAATAAAPAAAPAPAPAPAPAAAAEAKEPKRLRCAFCRKRVSIATRHTCRCGAVYCAPHRYAEVHGCAYDYKAAAHTYLQRANPPVHAPKLPRI